jgi:hypothetical protein
MNLQEMLKRAEKITEDNSPLILTAFGVAGTVATAVLTGKAAVKATEIIRREEYNRRVDNPDQTFLLNEQVRMVWKIYVPPVAMGTFTIFAIISANRVSTRRAAALAAAYSMSEKAYQEYKEKVIEKIGQNKERQVRDDLARDRVERNPVNDRNVIITGNGDVLCFDQTTGQYFESSMEAIRKAENEVNYKVLNEGYCSQSEFFDMLGLETTSISSEMGWNYDHKLDIDISTVMSKDKRPCLAIDYTFAPGRFDRFHD